MNSIACKRYSGLTLIELIVSMVVMAILLSMVTPQFYLLRKGWNSRQIDLDTRQNVRIGLDHITRCLSECKEVIEVSPPDSSNSSITFVGASNVVYICRFTTDNFISFGQPDRLSPLAGPFKSLRFLCYSKSDPQEPTTDPASIGLIVYEIGIDNPLTDLSTYRSSVCLPLDNKPLIQENKLVGCYPLDESRGHTANDVSGMDNHGRILNMGVNDWVDGRIDGALQFKGNQGRIQIPDNDTLDLVNEGTITAWIWIYSHKPFAGLVHKGVKNDFSDEAYSLQFWSGNKLTLCIHPTYGNYIRIESRASLTIGQWYHVAAVWDTGEMHLYLNGKLDTSINQSVSVRATKGDLVIGSQISEDYSASYKTFPFDGIIDQVCIYHKALNEAEIRKYAYP